MPAQHGDGDPGFGGGAGEKSGSDHRGDGSQNEDGDDGAAALSVAGEAGETEAVRSRQERARHPLGGVSIDRKNEWRHSFILSKIHPEW